MGLYASFDVIGDFGFIAATEEWGIVPDYGPGCDTFVSTFTSSAQGSCPVDTGYLRSTISANTDGSSFCECQATAEYAQYVEYGTWKMYAQPYFTPALEAAIGAAAPLWEEAQAEAEEEDARLTAEQEALEKQAMQAATGGGGGGGISFQDGLKGFIMSTLAAGIVAMATVVIQAALGKDFSESDSSDIKHKSGEDGGGGVFIPDVIIT